MTLAPSNEDKSHAAADAPAVSGGRWSVLRRFFRILALVYLGVAAMMYAFQAALIFPGGGPVLSTPSGVFTDLQLEVPGGTTHGWFVPHENARGTVLISHGNGENVESALAHGEVFREQGFNVLVYDYGGYGHSTGKSSEARCYEDIGAMWNWLTVTEGIAPDSIVLYGRSLGGGVTTDLATRVQPAAVILESTFTSIADVAQKDFWFLPLALLIRHRFENLSKIGDVHAPLLLIHSTEDTLIPYGQGKALFEAANEPKTLLSIRGGHNDGAMVSGDLYTLGIAAFLDTVFPRE